MTAHPALIMFTETYPFDAGAEAMFVAPELKALQKRFVEITVIPQYVRGKRLDLPKAIRVETGFAEQRTPLGALRKLRYAAGAMKSAAIWRETLSAKPSVRRMRSLESAIRRHIDAQYARDWVKRFSEDEKIDPFATVFYTYWLGTVTDGLVLARNTGPHAPRVIVSRAHGGDLYEERSTAFTRLPGRSKTLAGLERLFLISENGREYISRRYPTDAKYVLSRLGVPDPQGDAPASNDGICRVVSCSFLRALKRIDLLFDALVMVASERPDRAFVWTHIGDGELWQKLRDRVSSESPGNLTCRLTGSIDNDEVIRMYTSCPFDVFLNVSRTEGIPVSIMEAQSCGIPVIATAVGGTPEIVSSRVGLLLPANPTPRLVASALMELLEDSKSGAGKRTASKENWREKFHAEKNYSDFAMMLETLVTR